MSEGVGYRDVWPHDHNRPQGYNHHGGIHLREDNMSSVDDHTYWNGVLPWYVGWTAHDPFVVGYDLRVWTFGVAASSEGVELHLGPLWFEVNR